MSKKSIGRNPHGTPAGLDIHILQTYKRYPVVFERGRGQYIYDINGKKYLDFLSGIATVSLGYSNAPVRKAIISQTGKFIHSSNYFYIRPQQELAKILIEKSFPGRVFFSNSGAEANECAIKISRKWGNEGKVKRNEIITFSGSFHGRTLACLSATAQKKFHKGFEPLPSGFKYAVYNDFDSFRKAVTKKTVAVMIEPVLGEGGVYPANPGFIKQLYSFCRKNNILFIADEIQSGLGRTGRFFAYEHYGIVPDMVTLAKSLAQGLPLGATIVSGRVAGVMKFGDHGSTFGGNPVACAAAVSFISQLDGKMLKSINKTGNLLKQCLLKLQKKYSFITDVRGIGMMAAMTLSFPGAEIVKKCIDKGLIINCTQNNILRFLPPFIITEQDISSAAAILDSVFCELAAESKK